MLRHASAPVGKQRKIRCQLSSSGQPARSERISPQALQYSLTFCWRARCRYLLWLLLLLMRVWAVSCAPSAVVVAIRLRKPLPYRPMRCDAMPSIPRRNRQSRARLTASYQILQPNLFALPADDPTASRLAHLLAVMRDQDVTRCPFGPSRDTHYRLALVHVAGTAMLPRLPRGLSTSSRVVYSCSPPSKGGSVRRTPTWLFPHPTTRDQHARSYIHLKLHD